MPSSSGETLIDFMVNGESILGSPCLGIVLSAKFDGTNVEGRKLGWWMWMWIEIELECGLVFGGLLFFDFG